jgi:hypothetical protein
MKTSPLILLAGLAALTASSCSYSAVGYPAAGYSPRDAYYRGHVDGSGDRVHGHAYDPHINEDRSLPRAHRQDYLWGYIDGWQRPSQYGGGSK